MQEEDSSEVNSTIERQKKITELQYAKFGAIHELHTSRTANFLDELVEHLGEEVLQVAGQVEVDYQDLMLWHLKRTADLLNQLGKKFGPEVFDIIMKKERESRIESGKEISQKCEENLIEDIIPYFGGEQNVVEKSKDHCVIRTKYCALANAVKDTNIEEFVYHLHCCNDPSFVEGFNSNLGCEVRRSLLNGDEYCEHYIYINKSKFKNTESDYGK